jgi:hypothetical protein
MEDATAEVTWSDKGMSNFDKTVDPGMEEDLRAGMRGQHSAWNFHGQVWFEAAEGVFKEEVSVHKAVRGTLSAPTLEELMHEVNDEYGWD